MLISRVEEEGGTMGGGQDEGDVDDHSHEYQTANELFELMAKNNNFKPSEDESLTTRDLVLLYKNIDLGTKLMSNANEFKRKTPNQYVETVVYNEDPDSDSDISENYSSEDLHNVVLINKERIDLLTNPPSLENTLCQKLGDLEMQNSDLSTEYDRKFHFKDPYLKEQLKSFDLMSGCNGHEGTLPASLLDYICCKRLEDNYNFYMDNIIRYVKHTIEQLKRISNGDYLTDKAKEKWREVENYTKNDDHDANNTKILKSSTSIPLHVERKITGRVTTWDDIIHSEVDIRSLSKILEKKIVFEIPKLICGSYRIFSKCRADNFVVSCKKEMKTLLVESKKEESRVDVVFQLTRSKSGHVISNISSIMILQNAYDQKEKMSSDVLALPYKEADNIRTTEGVHDVMIVDVRGNNTSLRYFEANDNKNATSSSPQQNDIDSDIESTEFESSSLNAGYSSASSKNRGCNKRSDRVEAAFDLIPPDDLRLTMQRLNMQSSLPEESIEGSVSVNAVSKKKSPTRNRIKSPYENKSFIMEEKKRKRLLEIRQRREKSKIAMSEKVSKHRYGKGIMPQTSNSVTKLSITNKSFYNSIYGQSGVNGDHKPKKLRIRNDKKDPSPDNMSSKTREEGVDSIKTSVIRSQKFINRSYYLDDTITEMMYLQMKKKNSGKEAFSESTSAGSTDFNTNLKILSSLIAPSTSEINVCDPSKSSRENCQGFKDILKNMNPNNRKSLASSQSSINLVPVNTPKGDPVYCDEDDPKKSSASVKFRKSIDKIYGLMKKIVKPDGTETKLSKSKFTATGTDTFNAIEDRGSSTVQCSDSGTSIKHHLTSSNPSCISFEKANSPDFSKAKITNPKTLEMQSAMVPKVIISTKSQIQKVDGEKTKRDRKKNTRSRSPKVIRDNPLKAISQFLHEFDCVQKNRSRQPLVVTPKAKKKTDFPEGKNISRQVSYRKNSRLEQHIKDNELQAEKFTRLHAINEKKSKLIHTSESSRLPRQQINDKKQIGDIIDEVKESRGEAVRGPSKLNSRLNTLAQPKKTYVQARVEEFQSKYGRNRMSDRLQKLAAGPLSPNQESNLGSSNLKHKLKRSDAADMPITVPVKPQTPASLEKPARPRPLSSSSTEVSMPPLLTDMSYKRSTCTDSPNSIKKKMVAVESYVKNHYGRGSPTMEPSELLRGHQSRAPLLPNDFELSSLTSSLAAEESTVIGSKLHHIIDDMMIPSPPPLTVLPECIETNSKHGIDENKKTSLVENVSKEAISIYSYYHSKKFKDNAISTYGLENSYEDKDDQHAESKVFKKSTSQIDAPLAIQSHSSNEMEKLESALYRRISVGTFQKRLRIKNLTLTPKQSMQQVLLLQSGDARPVVLKSTISQEMEVSKLKSDTKDLNTLTGLSDSPLRWGFTNFPVQIATVGYAFPATQTFPCCSKSNALSLEADAESHKYKMLTQYTKGKKRIKSASEDKKIKQCYKGRQSESYLGHGNQTTVKDVTTSISVEINCPSIEKSGKEEHNDNFETSKINKNKLDYNMLAESVNEKTMVSEIIKIDEKEQTHTINEDTSVNYSTSLDILAGLLNEIQKITTCQTQMVMVNSDSKYCDTGNRNLELETILNESAALESSIHAHRIISISSLDKLRQLESNPSIYSLYVSNDGDEIDITEPTEDAKENVKSVITVDAIVETFGTIENSKDLPIRPVCADKEVTVEFPVRELVNNFTDTPSRYHPIIVNNSTTFSNSMLGVFSQPSSRSILSFTEHNTLFSFNKKVIEIPKGETKIKESKECQCSVLVNEDKKEVVNLSSNEMQIENKTVNDSMGKSLDIKKVTEISYTEKNIVGKHYDVNSEFDPGLRVKRDILVTVYSILVFTVFAALSFPEFMYHI